MIDKHSDLTTTTEFSLDLYNLNFNGEANVWSYFNLMQEAAFRHAHILGIGSTALKEKQLLWVATRFELHTFARRSWGQKIYIETWSRGNSGLHFYRDFLLYMDSEKTQLLGKASGSYATIDLATRKAVVFNDPTLESRSLKDKHVDIQPRKITFNEDPQAIHKLKVCNSDLDINNHVSNTKYIQWVYDSLPQRDIKNLPENGFAINYSAETFLNDEITIYKSDFKFQGKNQDSKTVFSCEFF